MPMKIENAYETDGTHHYYRMGEYFYTAAELEAAWEEARERLIEIVRDECISINDQHFLIKAIRKMGGE